MACRSGRAASAPTRALARVKPGQRPIANGSAQRRQARRREGSKPAAAERRRGETAKQARCEAREPGPKDTQG